MELVDSDERSSSSEDNQPQPRQQSTPKSAKQGYSLRKNQRVDYRALLNAGLAYEDNEAAEPEKRRSDDAHVILIESSPEHVSTTHRSRLVSDPSDEEVPKNDEDDDDEDDDVANMWGDDESEVEEERLWCICQKPSTGQFMIMCDECYDWYHGDCVGLTREEAKALKKNEDRYVCPFCKNNPEYFDRYKTELAKKGVSPFICSIQSINLLNL